jgi:SH3 domain protein
MKIATVKGPSRNSYSQQVSGGHTPMPFSHKFLIIISTIVTSLVLGVGLALAEQRYIVDTIVVALREGPGADFKPIKTLQTGQSFEVLETRNDFVRVRTTEGDEGWVANRYTVESPPNAVVVKELNEKITALTAQNEQLQAKTELMDDQLAGKGITPQTPTNESAEIKKLESELAELTNRYSQLEADAKDVLPVTTERDRLQQELKAAQESLATLEQTKSSLGSRENIYWFLAGSGVFLLGWIIGKVSCRRPRHSLTL